MATVFQKCERGNHFRKKKKSNKSDNYKVKESLENDNIKCEPGGKVLISYSRMKTHKGKNRKMERKEVPTLSIPVEFNL